MKGYPVGAPQELVLSPVSFYIFINALEKEMNILRIKFMDDTKLLDAFHINHNSYSIEGKQRGWEGEESVTRLTYTNR